MTHKVWIASENRSSLASLGHSTNCSDPVVSTCSQNECICCFGLVHAPMLASFEVALMLLSTRWKTQVSSRENSKYEKNFVNTFNVTTWGTTFFSSKRKYCLESQEGTKFCYSHAVLCYFTLFIVHAVLRNFPTNIRLPFKLALFSIFAQVFKDSVWFEEKVKGQKNTIGWFTQVMEDPLFFKII